MADRLNFPEFPNYYRSLSLRLCQVLDDLGASTALRDEDVKARTTEEILVTFTDWLDEEEGKLIEGKAAFYHVGSYFERTTIPGLKSDRDLLIVEDRYPVVTDVSDAQPYYDCLLMIQDSSTPPGYSKLQFVVNGVPRFVFFSSEQLLGWHGDKEGRAVLVPLFGNVIRGSVSHGPAETVEATQNTRATDYVDALRCRTVPDCASEWFTRQRHYNWPTTDCIDKCKTLGCFFVHVGHSSLEWRLSFSLQERLLVTSFNSAQLKVFVLLKIIKKEIIKPALVKDTLTSYHCKTCMFYMIENTPAEFWREDNLLHCLYSCLNMIKTWVETGKCPNYFVPAENMFDGKIFGGIRIRLHEILSSFLAADFRYLVELKTDDIGQRFQEAIVSEEHCDSNLQETMAVNHKYISHIKCILRQRLSILHWSQRGQQLCQLHVKD